MPKKNVKVELPRHSPDNLIKLHKRIIDRHEELGNDSPLKSLDMDKFKVDTEKVEELREQAFLLHAEAQALNQKARLLLGVEKGQNIYTEDTLYNMDSQIRDLLLLVNRNIEEELSTYGFNVVIRKSKLPKKKKEESSKGSPKKK